MTWVSDTVQEAGLRFGFAGPGTWSFAVQHGVTGQEHREMGTVRPCPGFVVVCGPNGGHKAPKTSRYYLNHQEIERERASGRTCSQNHLHSLSSAHWVRTMTQVSPRAFTNIGKREPTGNRLCNCAGFVLAAVDWVLLPPCGFPITSVFTILLFVIVPVVSNCKEAFTFKGALLLFPTWVSYWCRRTFTQVRNTTG